MKHLITNLCGIQEKSFENKSSGKLDSLIESVYKISIQTSNPSKPTSSEWTAMKQQAATWGAHQKLPHLHLNFSTSCCFSILFYLSFSSEPSPCAFHIKWHERWKPWICLYGNSAWIHHSPRRIPSHWDKSQIEMHEIKSFSIRPHFGWVPFISKSPRVKFLECVLSFSPPSEKSF